MNGRIEVFLDDGAILIRSDVWQMLAWMNVGLASSRSPCALLDLRRVRVAVDGVEVPRPEFFNESAA